MFTSRKAFLWILLFAGILSACSLNSTPPGDSSIGGLMDGASYSYHYWDEGLAILFWQDLSYNSGETCSGTGSTEDPIFRLECSVSSPDGRGYSWEAHTSDGVSGELWIEEQRYDLSTGNMFLVNVGEGGVEVEQLQRDLSELEPNNEAIATFAGNDPDVSNFIAAIEPDNGSPAATGEYSLAEFTEALRTAGQIVEIGGPVGQPFFYVPGQIVVVNGEDVQVFEYADSAAAQIVAGQIAPDASTVGNSTMSWFETPHFYSRGRLVVLYLGEDESVSTALVNVLGKPIAEGEKSLSAAPDEAPDRSEPADQDLLATLPEALINERYDVLSEMIGDPFGLGFWGSRTRIFSPEGAIEELQSNLLLEPGGLTFTTDRGEFPDLGEEDPEDFWGGEGQHVDLIYSQGWGAEGQGEAILIIGKRADGSHFWPAMIYGPQGFSEVEDPSDSSSPPVDSSMPGTASATSEALHPLAGLLYRADPGLWIIDENGDPVFVFDEPSSRLSADGRYVLFQPEYDPDIWLADLISGERRNLTEGSNRYNESAQWWPGQQDVIVFGSSAELGPGFGFPTVVRADGSDYRVLDEERSGPLALSSDGDLLAYGGFDYSGRVMRRGSEAEDFYPAEYGLDVEKLFQPAWSPNGRKLAWKVSGDADKHGWTSGVAVFDLQDKSAELFHTYTAVGGGSVPHYLSWSPNGEWLAFVTFNEKAEDGRRPNLWLARPDGQDEVWLGTAFESAWSPDGGRLAFTLFDYAQETFQTWLYDTESGQQRQIFPAGTAVVDWLVPTDELMQTVRRYATDQ